MGGKVAGRRREGAGKSPGKNKRGKADKKNARRMRRESKKKREKTSKASGQSWEADQNGAGDGQERLGKGQASALEGRRKKQEFGWKKRGY